MTATFASLRIPAMQTGPAADLFGQTSTLLSSRDLSNDENVKDAAFEFERARDDHQLARWSRRWAPALLARLQELPAGELITADDLDGVEEAKEKLERAIQAFVAGWDAIAEKISDAGVADQINDLVGNLEGAL